LNRAPPQFEVIFIQNFLPGLSLFIMVVGGFEVKKYFQFISNSEKYKEETFIQTSDQLRL
jgi:hypothetical protein